jgi:hypothetical protein
MLASAFGSRSALLALTVACLGGALAPEAGAITYGVQDCAGGAECRYPNTVSLSGFRPPQEGEGTELVSFLRCSGSLLDVVPGDRFVILTAGHCASGYLLGLQDGTLVDVGVSFDSVIERDLPDVSPTVWSPAQYVLGGQPVLPEEYGPQGANASNIQFDYAVIVFTVPEDGLVRTSSGAVVDIGVPVVELPDEDFLEDIVSATTPLPLTAVGYGTGEAHEKPGEGGRQGAVNDLSKLGVRWITELTSAFHFMGPEGNLLFGSQNPARGHEGTCGGDSGGPLFFDDGFGEIQVGITSSGDAVCRASSIIARTDSTRAVQFLSCVLEPGAERTRVLTCGCTTVDRQGECPGPD